MIQILELFGGIGSPRCALRNIGIPVKAIDFEMYFMQGMDYAEIAEELDTGKNTPRRWVTGIINELSVLLWGIDEERVK